MADALRPYVHAGSLDERMSVSVQVLKPFYSLITVFVLNLREKKATRDLLVVRGTSFKSDFWMVSHQLCFGGEQRLGRKKKGFVI